MLTLSLYGAPRCFISCNVPAAHFFRYVISNLVFEILFSTRAKSKRLTYMTEHTGTVRCGPELLSSSDTSFRLHGRAVVAGGSRGTASGERRVVAGGSRGTAGKQYLSVSCGRISAMVCDNPAILSYMAPLVIVRRDMIRLRRMV